MPLALLQRNQVNIMNNKPVLITGVTGQDGAYLAQRMLQQNQFVVGTLRPGAKTDSNWRLRELEIEKHPQLQLVTLDLENESSCVELIRSLQPKSIFHLAGQTSVAESFRQPLVTARLNGLATLHLLEALRHYVADARFVFASSAELFGGPSIHPQDEYTPFHPRNPYAIAKHFAHLSTVNYRVSYGLHTSCAILFNHESPLRDKNFITRKITLGVAHIAAGKSEEIALGNLDAQRDFGFAPDYVAALAAMAEPSQGDDFVLATGIQTSIREFVHHAFSAAGMEIEWRRKGIDEIGIDRKTGKCRVRVDPIFFRPLDASILVGNATKARSVLGFMPRMTVAELAQLMVKADMQRVTDECG